MNDTPETLASRRSRAWWARPGVWIITVGVAAIVVIEGFALSWGGTTSRPSMDSSATVVTFAKQPSYQASCVGGHTYLEVDYLRYASGLQPATITGHEATYQCGGPDDGQFTVLPTVRTIALSPRVKIELFEFNPSPVYYDGSLRQLNEYLATDIDRTFFLVVGPPSGATTLRAMYVP